MTFNIIVKENKDDSFVVPENSANKNIVMFSFQFNREYSSPVSHDINYWIKKSKLSLSDQVVDFLNFSLAVYTSDQIISRSDYGYYGWSRYIRIYLPVLDTRMWEDVKSNIENILSFLTGDKWEVYFRKRKRYESSALRIPTDIDSVALLSGGLDSFLGAIEICCNSENIVFVSHHKKGNAGEMDVQIEIIQKLRDEYSQKEILHFPFYVQPNSTYTNYGDEKSQRARSIIFIALGIIVANSHGNNIPLYIPENGLISLNVPLTITRLGSFSTKTTHPKFLRSLNSILKNLGIENEIINPYKFLTKGEMLLRSKNLEFVKKYCRYTISCAKPGYFVRLYGKKELQCGFCTPCIIRQAAMAAANLTKYDSKYVLDIDRHTPLPDDSKGEDLQAFRIGIERANTTKFPLFNILTAGDLPGDETDLNNYLGVYIRGLNEVKKLLKKP